MRTTGSKVDILLRLVRVVIDGAAGRCSSSSCSAEEFAILECAWHCTLAGPAKKNPDLIKHASAFNVACTKFSPTSCGGSLQLIEIDWNWLTMIDPPEYLACHLHLSTGKLMT